MNILLVDDEPLVLVVVERILKSAGHRVAIAQSAKEALKICEESGSEFDLILSDVIMPEMDGQKLAECAGGLATPIPVILMSGYTPDSPSIIRLVEGGKLENCPFIQKPFTPAKLLEVISKFAQERSVRGAGSA